jgi:hypothetical protein
MLDPLLLLLKYEISGNFLWDQNQSPSYFEDLEIYLSLLIFKIFLKVLINRKNKFVFYQKNLNNL